jgi:hypothetical protein
MGNNDHCRVEYLFLAAVGDSDTARSYCPIPGISNRTIRAFNVSTSFEEDVGHAPTVALEINRVHHLVYHGEP